MSDKRKTTLNQKNNKEERQMEKLERGIEKHGKVIGFFIDLIYRLTRSREVDENGYCADDYYDDFDD